MAKKKITFKKKQLVDREVAERGLWMTATSQDGREFGEFKVRYFDQHRQSVAQETDRLKKRYAKINEIGKLTDEQAGWVILCHYILIDWRGILEDETDKEVPFDPDLAMEFFSDEDNAHVAMQIFQFASNPGNFKPTDDEDIEGNS